MLSVRVLCQIRLFRLNSLSKATFLCFLIEENTLRPLTLYKRWLTWHERAPKVKTKHHDRHLASCCSIGHNPSPSMLANGPDKLFLRLRCPSKTVHLEITSPEQDGSAHPGYSGFIFCTEGGSGEIFMSMVYSLCFKINLEQSDHKWAALSTSGKTTTKIKSCPHKHRSQK